MIMVCMSCPHALTHSRTHALTHSRTYAERFSSFSSVAHGCITDLALVCATHETVRGGCAGTFKCRATQRESLRRSLRLQRAAVLRCTMSTGQSWRQSCCRRGRYCPQSSCRVEAMSRRRGARSDMSARGTAASSRSMHRLLLTAAAASRPSRRARSARR